MARYVVASTDEIGPGTWRVVDVNGRSVGIYNVDGAFYAVRNRCPHQGVPVCEGQLSGTFLPSAPQVLEYGMEGRVISCPSHRWQFDVTTGRSIAEPDRYAVRTYPVEVEAGQVVLTM